MTIPPFDTNDSELDDEFSSSEQTEGGAEYEEEQEKEPRSSNRGFALAIGIIGGIGLLGLIGLALFLIFGKNFSSATNKAAEINAQNTAIAMYGTATEIVNQQIQTLQALPTNTKVPTQTPVVAPTNTPVVLPTTNTGLLTQTAVAALTLQPSLQTTPQTTVGAGTPQPTSTGIPDTGIMDDLGLPALFGGALVLIAIIIVARRLRLSSHQ